MRKMQEKDDGWKDLLCNMRVCRGGEMIISAIVWDYGNSELSFSMMHTHAEQVRSARYCLFLFHALSLIHLLAVLFSFFFWSLYILSNNVSGWVGFPGSNPGMCTLTVHGSHFLHFDLWDYLFFLYSAAAGMKLKFSIYSKGQLTRATLKTVAKLCTPGYLLILVTHYAYASHLM